MKIRKSESVTGKTSARKREFMKLGITKFVIVAAVAVLVVVSGSATVWAQNCPASAPNFSPDFSNTATSNQACLTLNNNGDTGFPSFQPVVNPPTPPPVVTTVLRLTPNATFTAGSAWFTAQQPVAGPFSTTFTFELTGGNTADSPADGIAFVVQNSGVTALGPDGCGIGFGESTSGCAPPTGGIANSLAVEFNTYNNGTGVDPSNNDVTIQNCGLTGANSVDQSCSIAVSDLTKLANPINMADGNVHTVTITYAPSTLSNCGPEETSTCSTIDVILDGNDLFPPTGANPVLFNLTSIGLANGNNCSNCLAWVGFTAATGGGDDNQDILSWTFTPGAESGTVTTGTETVLNFEGGFANGNGYDANAQLTSGSPQTVQVNAIQQTTASCTTLVRASFPGAECFGYNNSAGSNPLGAVMFEYTCPGSSTAGTCGSVSSGSSGIDFFATLGTDLYFDTFDNPGLFSGSPAAVVPLPLVGWLKGAGLDPLHPCTPNPDGTTPLFQSNQISSFMDPAKSPSPGNAKGSSGGTGSCWVLTYLTPGENPTVSINQPVNGSTYQQNQMNAATQANYMCTTVFNGVNTLTTASPTPGATGPYLTGTCSATDTVGGSVAQGAQFDTSTLGPHTFTATVLDSALNTVSQTVTYNVVAATNVAILNAAPSTATTGSRLTYLITAWDSGPANAVNTVVTDTLAAGTTFLSASGINIGFPCTTVGGKTSCKVTYAPITCTAASNIVTCPVGTIMPVSLFDLNGAIIEVTVQVTATGTKANPAVLSNTATVTQSNAETKQDNSSTATTKVP
jgi:uncharacterized repeat protein (TIGR01451 family)